MKKVFNFRLEEFPSISKMVRDSFARDLTDFTAYSAKYDAAYLAALDLKLVNLDNLVNNKIKIGEVKQMTAELYNKAETLLPILMKIEGYVINAEGLSIPAKNFRFKEARKEIHSKDMEGVLLETKTIKKLLEDNIVVLQVEGYSPAMHTEFSGIIADIESRNLMRNLKVDEKESVIQANMTFLNELYKEIKRITDSGKRIYRFVNKEKTGDYTISTILNRISNRTVKEPKNKGNSFIEGIVKDFETELPIYGVKVYTNNTTEGVITGADGRYRLNVEAETAETIYASMEGYILYEEELEIDAGVTMELDVEMEKAEAEEI